MDHERREIVEMLQQFRVFQFIEVASFAILLYDYALSFSDELQYIWSARWNTGKWLYLAIRYIATVEITVTTIISLAPGARSEYL